MTTVIQKASEKRNKGALRRDSQVCLLSQMCTFPHPADGPGPDLAVGFGRSGLLSSLSPWGILVVLNFFLPHRDVVRL